MATTDLHFVAGSLQPVKRGVRMLGGAVDDGVQVDATAVAQATANYTSGTVTAWVMIPDNTGTYAIFSAGDANAVEYFTIRIAAGKVQGYCDVAADVAWDVITDDAVITPHKWHHVAFVQDVRFPKIYVDGVKVAQTNTNITEGEFWFDDLPNVDGAHIGATDSAGGAAALTDEFKGYISNVKIWGGLTTTGALTAAQVLDDYNGVSNTTALYNHWTLDQTLADLGTGADTGSAVGDIIFSDANPFASRLTFLETVPLVADNISISCDNGVGYAYSVLAA